MALCCLCLLLFLPVTATEKWCNISDNVKWLTGELQNEIKNLNDNLLPSMIKYNTFTNVKAAALTNHCFIIVTAEQLNNTLRHLISHFMINSSNYNLIQRVVNYLERIYTDSSDESSHQCLIPDTKVVTGCKSDLFAYFHAVLGHYIYIFDQCKSLKQATELSESYLFFLKASDVAVASNCCLIDLHNGSSSSYFYRNSPTKSLYNASVPEPFCSLMSPVQSVTHYKLIPSIEATSAVTSVVTEDESANTVTRKDALLGNTTDDPHNSSVNLMQAEANNGGSTVPNMLPASMSATSPSQTIGGPTGKAGTVNSLEQHPNSHIFQYLFIGTAVALVFALAALVHLYFKIKRLKQRFWNEVFRVHDSATSESFLVTEV